MRHNDVRPNQSWSVAPNACTPNEVLVQVHAYPDQARISLPVEHVEAMALEMLLCVQTIRARQHDANLGAVGS